MNKNPSNLPTVTPALAGTSESQVKPISEDGEDGIVPAEAPTDIDIDLDLDLDPTETQEWKESLQNIIHRDGPGRAQFLLSTLGKELAYSPPIGDPAAQTHTPYHNTIPISEELPYPGDIALERRITAAVRWNAMAIVLRANHKMSGIGGHIASFASSATIYEVGYNHFFKGPRDQDTGDKVFFQGHISPGIYARAFLEGILSEQQIENFRRELLPEGGLPSYPHPRLVPGFWQFATVSMGLGPLMAIYHARFDQWLHKRGLKDNTHAKVIAHVGDGETDEVETLGALSIAARENLGNLIFVVNCNLQRLDGPVRGNSKIIQELEGIFRGAGWNVIKVVWSGHWDKLFAKDQTGALEKLLSKTVDGDFQLFSTFSGAERRRNFFSRDPAVAELIKDISDEELDALTFGGHDETKIYNAYHRAFAADNGRPTVMLVKTIKGYGMGTSGEGRNIAHQQKAMSQESLVDFKHRFNIPIEDDQLESTPFYQFDKNSDEIKYINDLRSKLGGFIPQRRERMEPVLPPDDKLFKRSFDGTGTREISSTMAFVSILTGLLRDKNISKHIVPIVPDESRTFGMEGLFRQFGIYAPKGQLYTPVDKQTLAPYKESTDGQIFQEGINEAGAMSTFVAAGTSYSHTGVVAIPFYVFYSMFGLQRTGDLFWAAADMKTRGFLIGGTAGRTTLNGEGLQHEDGHSHILASTVPNLRAYDPAFSYELAVIIRHGIKAMYEDGEDAFYYITVYNENYAHPPLPTDVKDIEEGIIKGIYLLAQSGKNQSQSNSGGKASKKPDDRRVNLLASGVTVLAAQRAAKTLAKKYGVASNLYSVTSFKALREDAVAAARTQMLRPEDPPQKSTLETTFAKTSAPFVAATDYMKSLPDSIAPFLPGRLVSLGTDGFGRSSSREELRTYFEVNEDYIVLASLYALYKEKQITLKELTTARKDLNIDPNKVSSLLAI